MSTPIAISTQIVPENRRMNFWPNLIGTKNTLLLQEYTYRWANRLYADYTGGYWNFVSASNGGAFMVLVGSERISVSVNTNGYEGTVSATAAGIIATLYAACELANRTEDDRVVELYYQLREIAALHAEAGDILKAID